jgi:hypothetical protein
LTIVHDVASRLLESLRRAFGNLDVAEGAILFGAATHDIGKTRVPKELVGPGKEHEAAGRDLLVEHGIEPALARFAETHGTWRDPDSGLEDLLVAFADKIWKAKRIDELEERIARDISEGTGMDFWGVLTRFSDIAEDLAHGAEARLDWLRRF